MSESEKTYLDGFNAGYKLAQFQPELFEKIRAALDETVEYDKGILMGAKQWEQDAAQARLKELQALSEEASQENEEDQEVDR